MNIWEILLGVVLAFMIGLCGFSIANGESDAAAANEYFNDITQVIAESDYAETVINSCIEEAAENGYELSVSVVGDNGPGSQKYAVVTMKYKYEMPIFKVSSEKQKNRII